MQLLPSVSGLLVFNRAVDGPSVGDGHQRASFWGKSDDFNFLAEKAVWECGLGTRVHARFTELAVPGMPSVLGEWKLRLGLQ